jgi:hypothetical protein
LTKNYTKGSEEEIEALTKDRIEKAIPKIKAKFEDRGEHIVEKIIESTKLKIKKEVTSKILYQKYIIYDFETDTHTDIHKPNHVEVDVLQIDENETHDYNNCLLKSFGIKWLRL